MYFRLRPGALVTTSVVSWTSGAEPLPADHIVPSKEYPYYSKVWNENLERLENAEGLESVLIFTQGQIQ